MRKTVTYILLAAGIFTIAASCRRIPAVEEEGNYIRIDASLGTKAIINSTADLTTDGSKVQSYDLLTGFTGEIDGTPYSNANVTYIDEELTYGSDAWNFAGLPYPWTRTGIHHFFGWLTYDAKSGMYTSTELNPSYSSNTLSIPSKSFTVNSHQFDFLYSRNVEVRNTADRDFNRTVPLQLAHLFSAFALTVENRSNEPITLNSVTMPNLPVMNGSATINYSPDGRTAPVVTYTAPSTGGTPFFTNQFSGGKVLAKKTEANRKVNAFTGAFVAASAANDYRLLWPVEASVLSPTTDNPFANTPGHDYQSSPHNPADSLIRISYSFTVTPDDGTPPYTITREDVGVKLPNEAFAAGKKTAINVTINDKVVDLTFEVQPWEVEEYPLEFSSQSATVTSSFKFTEGTYSHKDGDKYYTDGANAIEGRFKITNPVGARIMVNPIGDAAYFTVTLNHNTVDPTVDMGEIVVSVKPNTAHGIPSGEKQLTLGFYLINGVQEINIDSEVRMEGATIVWSN